MSTPAPKNQTYQEVIDDVLPRVRDQVQAELRARILETVTYQAQQEVSKAVSEYFKEHIGPEVATFMDKKRADIVAGIVVAIGAAGDEVGKQLADELRKVATKTMSDTYGAKRVIMALLGETSRY